MSAEFYQICERILSATANGVYQGIGVALVAGLALRWLVRTNAATRHAVWFGVLLFVAALIPAHIVLSCRTQPQTPAAASVTIAPAEPVQAGDQNESRSAADQIFEVQTQESDIAIASETPAISDASSSGEAAVGQPGAAAAKVTWLSRLAAILQNSARKLDQAISLPHWLCLGLVAVWGVLACIRGGLMAFRLGEVRRIKTRSELPGENLQNVFNRLCATLATRRQVRLKISSAPPTAMLLGFVHPVVILPADMDQDADNNEVEHVLRHELAHVQRHDDWSNLAQQLVQSVLFFHPAIWWISARLSLEREIACDDHVLAASGRPRAYALTLANVAARRQHGRYLLAPGVSNHNSQLNERITMILNPQRNRSPRLAKSWLGVFATATAGLAALAIVAAPRLVLAQSSSGAPPAPVAPPSAPTPSIVPDWSAKESGPRIKADISVDAFSPQPAGSAIVPDAAVPAVPPVPAMPALAPVAAVHAHRLAQAAKTDMVVVATPGGGLTTSVYTLQPPQQRTIEERLDRIERILTELEAHDGVKPKARVSDPTAISSANGFSASTGTSWSKSADAFAKRADEMVIRSDKEAVQRAAEAATRAEEQAERAVEARQRAVEQSQRTIEARERGREQAQRDIEMANRKAADAPLSELQALRTAHESLQTELKTLERQIERIEQDQNRPKKLAPVAVPDGGSSNSQPSPEKAR